jgi:hypothetical protein
VYSAPRVGDLLLTSLEAQPDLVVQADLSRRQSRLLLAKGAPEQQRGTAQLLGTVARSRTGHISHVDDWAPQLDAAMRSPVLEVRASAYRAGVLLAGAADQPHEASLVGNLVANGIAREPNVDLRRKLIPILGTLAPSAKAAEAHLQHIALAAPDSNSRATALKTLRLAATSHDAADRDLMVLTTAMCLRQEQHPAVLDAALNLAWDTGIRTPFMARAVSHVDTGVAGKALRMVAESAGDTPWPQEVLAAIQAQLTRDDPWRQRAAAASLAAVDPHSHAALAADPRHTVHAGYLDAVGRGQAPARSSETLAIIGLAQRRLSPEVADALLRAAPVIGIEVRDDQRARLVALARERSASAIDAWELPARAPERARVPARQAPHEPERRGR